MGYASDITIYVKLCPRNTRGVVPLANATEVSLLLASRAFKPLPPSGVTLNFLDYASWPTTTSGNVTLRWTNRSRALHGPGTYIYNQNSATSETIEGVLKIEALVNNVVKRTWNNVTDSSQVYTIAQRTADDADLSKPVKFRITPINGIYTGTIRITPSFIMS